MIVKVIVAGLLKYKHMPYIIITNIASSITNKTLKKNDKQ